MAVTLGEARVNIRANLAPLKRGLLTARGLIKTALRKMAISVFSGMTTVMTAFINQIKRTIRTATRFILLAMATIGIASTKFAVDMIESANLFDISMGRMVGAAKEFTMEMTKSLGLNETSIKKYLGTFNLMLTSMGIVPEKAFEMSRSLTKLTFDLASFRNQSFEDAFVKISAGIIGETRPLRRLGVLLNETRIKNRAITEGVIEQGEELDDLQKVYLRVDELLEQTTKDQGDFQRTMKEGANVFRRFADQLRTTGEAIGKVLLPQLTKAIEVMRQWLVDNKARIESFAQSIVNMANKIVDAFKFIMEGVAGGDIGPRIRFLINDIAAKVKAGFERIKPKLVSIGRVIGDAIADGIIAGIGDIAGKFHRRQVAEAKEFGRLLLGVAQAPAVAIENKIVRSGGQGLTRFGSPERRAEMRRVGEL